MYVVFHSQFPHQDKRYFKTHAGARRSMTCSNRNIGKFVYLCLREDMFNEKHPVKTKVVKNLMTGQDVVIAEDTPRSCDPSSELFWSM